MYPDIYFVPEFAEVNKRIEGGEPLHIVIETEDGKIENSVIKREIPIQLDGETYYDLTTPYGYGGPIITELKGDKARLIQAYQEYMDQFVKENKIVSEFVRFHPIFKNDEGLENIYHVKSLRPVVQTKIHEEDTFQKEFSKSNRKKVRQTLRRNNVELKVTQAPDNVDSFKKIYYDTMDRVDANDFYFFDDEYFDALLKEFKDHIVLIEILFDDVVAAAGFYFFYDGILHAHLSGTNRDYLEHSPAYLIRYIAVEWGEKNGARLLYNGGGTTNDENDSLYRFKKRFSNTPDLIFKVGTKIWQPEIYDALVEEVHEEKPDTDFFPLYRFEKTEEDEE